MDLEEECDVLDPERLIPCPYNKHHQIRACRFPYHLVKCKKSYPEVAKKLATCPFNARHLVPQADLSDHVLKCSDKGLIEQDTENWSSGFQREQMNAMSTWQAPPCDEDWETELSEQSDLPFVWGMINSGINSSSTTSEQKNCLPSTVRAPASFPDAILLKHPDRTSAASSLNFVTWVHGASSPKIMENPL
ncbi:gametocyte-specific factor 1-like isoform X1 [Athene noctua]|uniref:gametocyte-specific factor 1-like isoform X1 n=1 Tax=Athene noctua TaxID=126797 RepID=UPI003EB8DD90